MNKQQILTQIIQTNIKQQFITPITVIGLDVSYSKIGISCLEIPSYNIIHCNHLSHIQSLTLVQRAYKIENELQQIKTKIKPTNNQIAIAIEAHLENTFNRQRGMYPPAQLNAIVQYQTSKLFHLQPFTPNPASIRKGLGLSTIRSSAAIKTKVLKFVTQHNNNNTIQWTNSDFDYDIADSYLIALHSLRLHIIHRLLDNPYINELYSKKYQETTWKRAQKKQPKIRKVTIDKMLYEGLSRRLEKDVIEYSFQLWGKNYHPPSTPNPYEH